MRRTLRLWSVGRLWLAGLLALSPLLGSCSSLGEYEATIEARNADSLLNIYLVVAERGLLEGHDDPDRVFNEILQPSQLDQYHAYVQIESEQHEGGYRLRFVTPDPETDLVRVTRDKEWTQLLLEVERSIHDELSDPAVLLVADFGSDGVETELVTAGEIANQNARR